MRPPLDIRITDAHIGIWQDNPQDDSFRREVYTALLRGMRRRGWAIQHDPDIRRNYAILDASHRLGERGTLRCAIEISGRVVKVEYWSMTAPQVNRNGRRYDFDRIGRMSHMDSLRVELEYRRVIAWLETIAPIKVDRTPQRDMPAMERIARGYAESWHSDKALGRPVCKSAGNAKSGDGQQLEHGQTVWFPDRKGRIVRGTAYYNINNMWWVVAGGKLFNEGCHSLLTAIPHDLRVKRNGRARRNALERQLAQAIERMDFARAQTIKTVLFGGEETFLIWARDHNAYYRSQYAGYTTDRIQAGKYTRAEAERECRRVPDELEMVCPDGSHVRFPARAA
jgi:hypothetical protein